MQPATKIRCWFQGDGAATFLSGTNTTKNTTVDITGGGGRIGVDYRATPCWIVGGGAGFHSGTLSGNGVKKSLTVGQVFAQTELRWRRFVLRVDGGFTDSEQTDFGASLRIPNEIGFSILEPIVGFRNTHIISHSRLALILGGRYTYRYRTPLATVLPSVDAFWIHADNPIGLIAPADLDHITPAYIFPRAVMPPNLFHLGVGVTSQMGRSLDLSLRYAVQMGSGTSHHAIIAAMNWNF